MTRQRLGRADLVERLSELCVRRRVSVVVLWLIVAVAMAPLAASAHRKLAVAPRVQGSEAAAVDSIMATRFTSPFTRYAVLVAAGVPSPSVPEGRAELTKIISAIDTVRGVSGQLSYLTSGDTLLRGPVNGTFVIVGLSAATAGDDSIVPRLRAATASVARELARSYRGATLRWSGTAAINHDMRIASAAEARAAELRVMPLTLLLLFLAFGALVASTLPLVVASVAIVIALGIAALINAVWPLSILLQNMTTMIGLGAGIDYALLTVSRYREARRGGMDSHEAAQAAARHAGSTIAVAGATVIIGLGALLLIPFNELQSVGVGGILVVAISVLMSTTFLPALLAILGPRVDAGRVRGRAGNSVMPSFWRSWGERVVRRPVLVLLIASAPLFALAWQARRLDPRLPRGNWLPRGIESGLAIDDLHGMRRSGVVNTVRLLIELPSSSCLFTQEGWWAVSRATAFVKDDQRIGRVASFTSVLPGSVPPTLARSMLPEAVRRMFVAPDECFTLIEAIPREGLDINDVTSLVRDLRRPSLDSAIALAGARVRIGGTAAVNADNEDAIAGRAPRIIALVVAVTLLALMMGFRSVLVPIKAVALNLLSIGAVVLVFQDGHGASLVGLDRPLSGVFPAIPILVFCIVFGLSMDYEVFLVARVAEARRRVGEHDAIIEGLQSTGGVITSAAAIMIVVFAAFSAGSFYFIKILGFALAVAVFVDATVVRLAVGPALLVLAGRWNWWPSEHRAPGRSD